MARPKYRHTRVQEMKKQTKKHSKQPMPLLFYKYPYYTQRKERNKFIHNQN